MLGLERGCVCQSSSEPSSDNLRSVSQCVNKIRENNRGLLEVLHSDRRFMLFDSDLPPSQLDLPTTNSCPARHA